jgi:hypothetical protein
MQPFGDDYLARREKEIEELYVLRSLTRAVALLAIASTVGFVVTALQGSVLALILGLFMLSLLIGTGLLWAVKQGKEAADAEIRRERERVLEAYRMAAEAEKPKRDVPLRLADDGEIAEATEEQGTSKSATTSRRTTAR